jgi:hypothetical protein
MFPQGTMRQIIKICMLLSDVGFHLVFTIFMTNKEVITSHPNEHQYMEYQDRAY